MKRMNIMKNTVLVAALAVSSLALSQKKNETSAAVEYKNKYLPALQKGDIEGAKKAIQSAKEFIDLAAAHPDTKASEKTLYYKGEIYMAMVNTAIMSGDSTFVSEPEAIMEEARASWKTAFDNGKKYDSDIDNSVYKLRVQFSNIAQAMYNQEQFEEASEIFEWQAKFTDVVGEVDSSAIYFAGVCADKADQQEKAADFYLQAAKTGYKGPVSYNLAAQSLRKAGKHDEAMEVITTAREQYPTNKDLLLELVNINIDKGDAAGAEQALQDAISTDPNNPVLYYTIGTIYIDLEQNEKAEEALKKALELKPDFLDAEYQLGAHLVTWAGDLRTKASKLDFGDVNYDIWNAQSDEIYQRAVEPLENYIEKQPKDKAVLQILFQLHRNLGNSEKALEYKKRYDAL